MGRKLFCELSPLTYRISVDIGITRRLILWQLHSKYFVSEKSEKLLPIIQSRHKSLIRRKLGNVNMVLQENKEVNLTLVAPKVNGILIKPGQVFSFWKLVGQCNVKKGFKEGLVIKSGKVSSGIGGGMCQFTNLLHWMILHSPLTIIEHHHHNKLDMFPDYGRQVPFGVGTSIMYNYLDYQFKNKTDQCFQLVTYVDEGYLCGELRCQALYPISYHIREDDGYFTREGVKVYRNNRVYQYTYDKISGNLMDKKLIIKNHSEVLYDPKCIKEELFR